MKFICSNFKIKGTFQLKELCDIPDLKKVILEDMTRVAKEAKVKVFVKIKMMNF